jgi:hypothetical protein
VERGHERAAPPSDLTFVEPLGTAQVAEPGGSPVDVVEAGKGVDHGEGDLGPVAVGVERGWRRERVHTLDALHEEERAAEDVVVLAQGHDVRVGHACVPERSEQAVLAAHALVRPLDRHLGGPAQPPPAGTPIDQEHDVRRAARQRFDPDRLPGLDPQAVEPGAETIAVDEVHAQRPRAVIPPSTAITAPLTNEASTAVRATIM